MKYKLLSSCVVDMINSPDILGMLGASAALTISRYSFLEPIGAVRVGRVNGEFVINPSYNLAEGVS